MAPEDEAAQQAWEHDESETAAHVATAHEHDPPSEQDPPSPSSWGSCWSSYMELRDEPEPDEDAELCWTEVRGLVAASWQAFGRIPRSRTR